MRLQEFNNEYDAVDGSIRLHHLSQVCVIKNNTSKFNTMPILCRRDYGYAW